MKIDLKTGWKKHRSDKEYTHLVNKDGHQLKVAHSALNPKMRGMLAQLPQAEMPHLSEGGDPDKKKTLGEMIGYPGSGGPVKKAEGGEVKDDVKEPDPKKAKKFVEDFNKPTTIAQGIKNVRKELGFAKGGEVPDDEESKKADEPPKVGYESDEDPYKGMDPEEAGMRRQLDEYMIAKKASRGSKGQRYAEGGEVNSSSQPSNVPVLDEPAKPVQQAPVVINVGAQQPAPSQDNSLAETIKHALLPGLKQYENQPQAGFDKTPAQGRAENHPPAPTMPEQPPQQAAPAPQAQPPQQQPQDMYGTEAYSKAYEHGLGEQVAGLKGQAAGEAKLGELQANSLNQQIHAEQQLQASYQQHYQDLQQERQSFQQDIQNQHIDPNHYIGSMDTSQKIATALGLIMGGLGSGITGQPSAALQFLNNQIDRDIAAQKANLGKGENLLNANLRQFGNLRDATDMTRAMMTDVVSNQLKLAAAKTTDKAAQARAQQAIGALEIQAAPVMSQIAMRRSILGGMQGGKVDPSQVIRMVIPKEQQNEAYKELKEAQALSKGRDNVIKAIDRVAKLNSVGNRTMNPLQSVSQIKAIKDPIIAELSKATAGRFTEQDSKMLDSLFPEITDTDESVSVKRAAAIKLLNEKMNFPILDSYGIHMGAQHGSEPIKERPIK